MQLMLTSLRYPGFHIHSDLKFNMYTAPAYFACCMNAIGAITLCFLFKEAYAGIVEDEQDVDEESKVGNIKNLPPPPMAVLPL